MVINFIKRVRLFYSINATPILLVLLFLLPANILPSQAIRIDTSQTEAVGEFLQTEDVVPNSASDSVCLLKIAAIQI